MQLLRASKVDSRLSQLRPPQIEGNIQTLLIKYYDQFIIGNSAPVESYESKIA